MRSTFLSFAVLAGLICASCTLAPVEPAPNPEAGTTVTLLFTNDVESAYDPTPAFWIEGIDTIGGIAEMATQIEILRETEPKRFANPSRRCAKKSTSSCC